MLIAFPVCLREREQALRLFGWIEEIGAGKNHDALLVLGKPAAAARYESELLPMMKRCFKSVTVHEIPIEAGSGWNPKKSGDATSANNMFIWGSMYCDEVLKRRFLWHEMDAIPTRASAYAELEEEDAASGKPFMGARENTNPPRLSGVAIYPTQISHHSVILRNAGTIAWDIAAANDVVPKAHFTSQIQNRHWLGNECRAAEVWDGRSALFHQCKCGCLIRKMRGVDKPGEVAAPLICAENAGSNPAPAIPRIICIRDMGERYAALFADGSSQSVGKLPSQEIKGLGVTSFPEMSLTNNRIEKALDRIAPRFSKRSRRKHKRTKEEQDAINSRMKKVRDAKKNRQSKEVGHTADSSE